MQPILLIDFGSTFTKLVAVDLKRPAVLAAAQSETTVQTDIRDGYLRALQKIEQQIGTTDFEEHLACSSARGGFKLIVIGLTESLTTEAAKRAVLGAGARILKVYAPLITDQDLQEMAEINPDAILLAGGTDGGNQSYILQNAKKLMKLRQNAAIVVAGNQRAYVEIERILKDSSHEYYLTENVMPKAGVLVTEPVRQVLRDIFMKKIVEAKGFEAVSLYIGRIVLPTPTAVLKAASLLAYGTKREAGLGELAVVDVGGATTDVHSVSRQQAVNEPDIFLTGLAEPVLKRTVEGDLGMRYSAYSLYQAVGESQIVHYFTGCAPEICEGCLFREAHPEFIPQSEEERRLDDAIASSAIQKAVERHSGFLKKVATPTRYVYEQTGKDLRYLKAIVGTGGALIHSGYPKRVLHAATDRANSRQLLPENPALFLDQDYVLQMMGLLSERYPDVALGLMKRHLRAL
ncbi:methylaspartate mutase accessory protein GlmL [Listeria aquatica]|uniref:methylaspartate mutase accessory protein GlmL n=1 Tax=Listeria aquatica TaxID=1494960 RepID=UPI003EF6663F